jgi:RNA polymerase sigma factor (sigma-70 family)
MKPSSLRHPARMAGASLLRLQSDVRLAELASSGHEAAFDAIVDRYRTPLARYCAGIVGPSRAEDAVQQALINAHDALQRTDEVRHLRSWLYRIAHNASLNVLRAVRDDVPLDEAAQSGSLRLPVDDGPAESFERSERFQATVAALQELPERQRAALVLRELEGRSHEEIAEALGVTKGAARQHLMRARVAVRGAVTAVTPYPLIARLSELLAGPSSAGWADAAVGAGAGATIAKLTAGVAATGALVGGAVGTERIVNHRERPSPPAAAAAVERVVKRSAAAAGATTPAALTGATAAATTPATGDDGTTAARRTGSKAAEHRGVADKDASRRSPAQRHASGGRPTTPVSPASSEPAASKGADHDTGNGRGPSARKDKSERGAGQGSKGKGSDTSSSSKGSSGKADKSNPSGANKQATAGTPSSSQGKGKSKSEKNGNGKASDPTPTATSPPAPEPTPDSGSSKSNSGKSKTDSSASAPGNSGSTPSVEATGDDD